MANRSKMVVMRLRPAEHELLAALAVKHETSVSQLVRELVLHEIQTREHTSKFNKIGRKRRS